VVVSMLLGTVITLVASILPALRATRVPPIAAVREGRCCRHRASRRMGEGGDRRGRGLRGRRLGRRVRRRPRERPDDPAARRGRDALFLGIALAAPHLVKPLASLVGWPARRAGGIAGDLASANAQRNPARTASTAAALMIGLTLVTLVATLGAGLRESSTRRSAIS
jgi:putative ABC transport system permease protein